MFHPSMTSTFQGLFYKPRTTVLGITAPSSRYQPSPTSPPSYYFGPSTPTATATAPSSSPRKKAEITATDTADIFTDPLLTITTASLAASTCTRDKHISHPRTLPTPSSTKRIGLLQPRPLPLQRSYPRTLYLHRFALEALQRCCSRPPLAIFRAIGRQQRPCRIFHGCHEVTVSRSGCCSSPFCGHRPRFTGVFVELRTPSGSKITQRRAYYNYSRTISYGSACPQRHETERFAEGYYRVWRIYLLSCCPYH